MARYRRRRRRRAVRRRKRAKFIPGDKVRISKISVSWTLPPLGVTVGVGVHLVVRTIGPSSANECLVRGGYLVGCFDQPIPWSVGIRAKSRVDCMECLVRHPDKT